MPFLKRVPPLSAVALEDRTTPATFGTPWPDAEHLTLSFVPDNTPMSAGGLTESLESKLSTEFGPGWQEEILRAFQTWAAVANINIEVVSDDGSPMGEGGPFQGADSHGDIRIGTSTLGPNEWALASPFDLRSDWAGDLLLNSQTHFGKGEAGTVDLFTVALHEAGHILGLGPQDDPTSVMNNVYTGPRTALSEGDIARIQELYGPRQPDVAVENVGWELVKEDSLSDPDDVRRYRVKAPEDSQRSSMVVAVWSDETRPAVTVTNLAGHPVSARVIGSDPSSLSLQIDGVQPGQTFLVWVAQAENGPVSRETPYTLAVAFRERSEPASVVAAGTFYAWHHVEAQAFENTRTQLVHFELALPEAELGAEVRLIIRNANWTEVHAIHVGAEQVAVVDVLLGPGWYWAEIVRLDAGTEPASYLLTSFVRSDPIGPKPVDPTLDLEPVTAGDEEDAAVDPTTEPDPWDAEWEEEPEPESDADWFEEPMPPFDPSWYDWGGQEPELESLLDMDLDWY